MALTTFVGTSGTVYHMGLDAQRTWIYKAISSAVRETLHMAALDSVANRLAYSNKDILYTRYLYELSGESRFLSALLEDPCADDVDFLYCMDDTYVDAASSILRAWYLNKKAAYDISTCPEELRLDAEILLARCE